ncbi:MAG: ABC transporter permease [Candidatus Rokuibacteriota bacterium]
MSGEIERAGPGRPGFWRRFWRHRPAFAGFVFLACLALVVGVVPVLRSSSPEAIDLRARLAGPSLPYPLGTDEFGRDILNRLLHGGRTSLAIGVVAMLVAITVGTVLGALAGYLGGPLDALLMRLTDGLLAIPIFFVLLTALTIFGRSLSNLILFIGLASWMPAARMVRGEILRTRELEYVLAAEALGASRARSLVRHVLPQTVPTMVVAATLGVAAAILEEAGLSYLGLGIQPPTPSWGNMLTGAQNYVFTTPELAVYPGALILLTVLAFNMLGDGLRDALDPYG